VIFVLQNYNIFEEEASYNGLYFSLKIRLVLY